MSGVHLADYGTRQRCDCTDCRLERLEQGRRAALVALADWLTDRDDYDVPTEVLAALCPDTPEGEREEIFLSVCRTVARTPAHQRHRLTDLTAIDLDYLTGARS